MRTTVACLLLLGGALASCATVTTYPPDDQPLGAAPTADEPVPTLMADAIEYSCTLGAVSDEPVINLPPGSAPRMYDRVIARLGEGRPMTDPDEPAYHVTKVRVRALTAQVDIFIPQAGGSYRFATLYFRSEPFQGYVHQRTQWWDTGDAPPPPTYAATAEPGGPAVLAAE